MKRKFKRIASLILALTMVLTLLQGLGTGSLVAKAEENPVYITLHMSNSEYQWGEPALQWWNGDTEVSDYGKKDEISGWGVDGYTLTPEENDWYKITLKGSFAGFQFLDFANPSNSTNGDISSKAMTYCRNEEPTDLYLKRDASNSYANEWFLDEELTTSIDTLVKEDESEETDENTGFYGTVNATSSNITIHYDNANNWDSVYAYLGNGANWTKLFGDWPGKKLEKDADGDYSFTVENKDLDELHFIYSNGEGSQTGNLAVTPVASNEEYWVSGETVTTSKAMNTEGAQYVQLHYFVPESWGWSKPALQYWGGTSTEVSTEFLGEIDGWGGAVGYALDFETTTTTGSWYKITLLGDFTGFQFLDYSNPSSNTSGAGYATEMNYCRELAATDLYLMRDDSNNYGINWYLDRAFTTGIETLIPSGTPTETTITMHFKNTENWEKVAAYACQGGSWSVIPGYEEYGKGWPGKVVEADENGWYTVSFTKNMDTLDIIFNNNGGGSQTENLYVTPTKEKEEYWVVDGVVTDYLPTTFTMHYYTTDFATVAAYITETESWTEIKGYKAAASWPGAEIKKDSKNANWYTVTVKKDNSQFNIIFNNNGNGQQTDNVCITPAKEVEERWISGVQGSTVVSEEAPEGWVPSDENDIYVDDNAEQPSRYVLVEYKRTNNDYEGWNIYCWDSGWGKKTEEVYPVEIDGKQYIIFPVKESTQDFNIGFCMRRTTSDEPWAEKDGGDHHLDIPAGQRVVHAVFTQGEGISYIYPYNTGYEMKGAEDAISFYYRDDDLVLTGEESKLSDVKVVVNGQAYDMTYSASNERFEATVENCASGDYAYYYIVGSDKKLDAFNEATIVYNDEECSLLTFKNYEALSINATVLNPSMDYNDNNVISVKLTGADAQVITTEEIASISADLSELGLPALTISPSLMEGTFAVLQGIKTGRKSIKVTMTDIYGNRYEATAKVKVTPRDCDGFDWDEAVIYFTVTDRFFDGNKSNNTGVSENDVDKTGSLSYHGGDFAGLTKKLCYLKELGVNTIWITPIVAQSDITTTKDGEEIESTGYHGYWTSDFTKLNGHLGTEKEFAKLSQAVHANGMKLMVDVVLNHAGYNTEDYFNQIIAVENEDGTVSYKEMIRNESNTIAGDNVYDSLANLPDFVTEDKDVADQLIEWQTNWVEKYGIDYFRVDTVKHVNTETWEELKNELTKIDPDFKMIGEYSGGGYTTLSSYQGAMDSLLDFDYNDQAQSFVKGNISSVESFLETRNANINNTSTLGAFLSSHDENGLVYKLINADGYSEEEALELFKVAAALELTSKGQVVIYYGEEIGLYGADNYPYQTNRYDFDWNEAAKQAKTENSMLNHYKKLLAIRNKYTDVLAKGTRTSVAVSDEKGYDVFSREYGNQKLYVALNIKAEQSISFKVDGKEGSIYRDLYSNTTYRVGKNNTVTIKVPASAKGGTTILVADNSPEAQAQQAAAEAAEAVKAFVNQLAKAIKKLIKRFWP